jgi:FUN14 domain-containing protein 1
MDRNISPNVLTMLIIGGICAGVFVKKGAEALAFIFGGVFVLQAL